MFAWFWLQEIAGVFKVYGIVVNPRHLSLIADYMTFEGAYRPFSRMGIESSHSPFQKMSYETTTHFLRQATLNGDIDKLTSPSARIVAGRVVYAGTGCMEILQPLGWGGLRTWQPGHLRGHVYHTCRENTPTVHLLNMPQFTIRIFILIPLPCISSHIHSCTHVHACTHAHTHTHTHSLSLSLSSSVVINNLSPEESCFSDN